MLKKKRNSVLIIEDAELNIVVLTRILESEYEINVARNGREGMEAAKELMPDVIILDIIMPEMNGYELIYELKHTKKTRNIPVIFITALNNTEDEERGLSMGGADYIYKPFSPAIVKLRVHNQLRILNYIKTIEQLIMLDQLTGVSNRRSFDDKLQVEWSRAKRERYQLSLLMVDIDDFKEFNDNYGHLRGDKALRSVAKVITQTLKRPGDLVARWGGEEFIVLLPNTDSKGAFIIADQIRRAVEATPVHIDDDIYAPIMVSIGTNTLYPSQDKNTDDFIQHTDNALYTAKRDGKNRVYCLNTI